MKFDRPLRLLPVFLFFLAARAVALHVSWHYMCPGTARVLTLRVL
jgi:hypothetical protein